MRFGIGFVLSLSLCAACVERSEHLTPAERAAVQPFVLASRPTPQHTVAIAFSDDVQLIGYDLSQESWSPSNPLTVTWYWKANRDLDDDYQLFTHLADSAGVDRINFDTNGPLRRIYPPGKWQPGEYLKDPQTLTLPADWNSESATFYLGIYRGDHRIEITSGPHDALHRARALTLPTPRGQLPTQPIPPVRPTPTTPTTPTTPVGHRIIPINPNALHPINMGDSRRTFEQRESDTNRRHGDEHVPTMEQPNHR